MNNVYGPALPVNMMPPNGASTDGLTGRSPPQGAAASLHALSMTGEDLQAWPTTPILLGCELLLDKGYWYLCVVPLSLIILILRHSCIKYPTLDLNFPPPYLSFQICFH